LAPDLTKYVQLNISKLTNISPSSEELQFNIIELSIIRNDTEHSLHVKVELQRVPVYHLMSTYIPSLSLIIIVELTLFFDESQLQSALALSLTIMLVMYTMFQSVQSDLPKTAFLIFIHYWLTFCLTIPFVVFLVEIFWELDRVRKEKTEKNRVGWCADNQTKSCISMQKQVQYIIIGSTFCFIFVYSTLAFYFFNTSPH
jgi:hypothetical protein